MKLNFPSPRPFVRWNGALLFICLLLVRFPAQQAQSAASDLQISVYCTADEVRKHLLTSDDRERVLRTLAPLKVSRLFLEGRRGDSFVPPAQLREAKKFFASKGIRCSGGIATVPGANFGVRQTGGLDWLNWESPKTQADVADFFTQNAPVFEEIIVDDFFCTGDISAVSEQARGSRDWGEYRCDLLVSLIEPMMVKPTRAADRRTRLILKYPQWYDRFHLFGYDPPRMSPRFDEIWVGTEVRNPDTPRWGYTQPTEGYMNFRWLTSFSGSKVRGAWFDHIECSAQNLVDQAYGSVLAGASELTLFHLGDLIANHPGDQLLANRLPELREVARRVHGQTRRGVAFYKPANADSAENMYLADYLAMIGLPVLPVATYPEDAKAAFLPVQAAGDVHLVDEMQRHLRRGATIVATPALLRSLGPEAARLAGVTIGPVPEPMAASTVNILGKKVALAIPLEFDAAMQVNSSSVEILAGLAEQNVPFLTRKAAGRGELLILNVRTYSEQDFRDTGEWLLSPKRLGLGAIPQPLADAIRTPLMKPLGVEFHAPAGVQLVLFGKKACVYSFRDDAVRVRFNGTETELRAHELVWLP